MQRMRFPHTRNGTSAIADGNFICMAWYDVISLSLFFHPVPVVFLGRYIDRAGGSG